MDGEEAKEEEGRVVGVVHNTGQSLEFRDGDDLVAIVGIRDLHTPQDLLAFAQVQLLSQVLQQLSVVAATTAVSAKAMLEMKRATAAVQSPDEVMDKVLSRVQVLMGAGKAPNVAVAPIRKAQGPRCAP
jgi:hypothetical protein